MGVFLYSAPNEKYNEHISRCKEKLKAIFPVFYFIIKKVVGINNEYEIVYNYFLKMVEFHDLGKLTKRWQERVGTNKKLPSHAPIGAAYLWKTLPENIKAPISFAVAIHHTDKGLLGDNIERPDVQAILDNIVDYAGHIIWDNKAIGLREIELFPEEAGNLTVNDLKEMARGLRVWARGCSLLEQHQQRLQASLVHHILKLCDISAATERGEYQDKEESHYGGWLMVDNIKNYVDSLTKRIGL
ncbi:MAG TPA: hypothetical protein ENI35_00345 [Candidatus Desulfofervidus auxilii]|uniref:HD Cas3-type domain-containing protein n=1 Tax=Desulfofervidus auxilii TaxID=1621989 RepID=A0A7C1VTM8_DESA2|nr:hypothetical protein [Candidatus Desulfofervidus auxilii]